ncbi:hypothetical protein ACWDFR_29840 [Streptomyces sp. 900105755]|uniref:Uncharacterized protein n=1 Tax=Streptomyces sp. 900105755 TaxID=3154389 RepID=A0ABV1TIT7_9ACTN
MTVNGRTYTSSDRPGAGTAGFGGMLLADALLDGFHHHGPPMGGPCGFGGGGGPGGPGGF